MLPFSQKQKKGKKKKLYFTKSWKLIACCTKFWAEACFPSIYYITLGSLYDLGRDKFTVYLQPKENLKNDKIEERENKK